jgi:hypothetical protein
MQVALINKYKSKMEKYEDLLLRGGINGAENSNSTMEAMV